MDTAKIETIKTSTKASLEGSQIFPEIVGNLLGIGVETYHVDLYRMEKTYYLPDGDSYVVESAIPAQTIGQEFDAAAVAAAVQDSQQGRHTYSDFLRKIAAAGTTQYFAYLAGRRVVYIGRDGSEHVELFPGAKN